MAEVEVTRSESPSGAAAACGARLGARGRDGARLLSRGGVCRRAAQVGPRISGRLRRWSSGARQCGHRGCRRRGPRRFREPQGQGVGRAILGSVLGSVFTTETLPEALRVRRSLGAGQSVVTRDGVWLGADWLRLSRDPEPHTGIIEREETLRALRAEVSRLETEVKNGEHETERRHERVRECEDHARAAANGGEPPAPRARRSARRVLGASSPGRCRTEN